VKYCFNGLYRAGGRRGAHFNYLKAVFAGYADVTLCWKMKTYEIFDRGILKFREISL
jgi:hypothetical protein